MQKVKLSDNVKSASEDIPEVMNACLFYGPSDIRYEEIPTPKINENEILVKVHTVLTGGTDLKTFKRGHPVLIKKTPSLFGHQFAIGGVPAPSAQKSPYPSSRAGIYAKLDTHPGPSPGPAHRVLSENWFSQVPPT